MAFHLEFLPIVKTSSEAFTVDTSTGAVTLLSCPPGRPSAAVSRFDALFTDAGMLLGIDSIVQKAFEK